MKLVIYTYYISLHKENTNKTASQKQKRKEQLHKRFTRIFIVV